MNQSKNNLSFIAEVNHTTDCLGLYRAELTRILVLMCSGVSDSMHLESILMRDIQSQQLAKKFVKFYELLSLKYSNDIPAMMLLFRKENVILGTKPILTLVDEGRLEDILCELLKE